MTDFLLLCGKIVGIWLVVSRVLTMLVVDGTKDPDSVAAVWASIFMMPVLLPYIFLSWPQMITKAEMYRTLRIITFGKIMFQKPSENIQDYIP
jgi:hypothetical protein